jgi:hypothetical protein
VSELGELYNDLKEIGKQKRSQNLDSSVKILLDRNIRFNQLSDSHYRVGNYDFWPSTGLFIEIKTKKRGRGVFNLIRKVQGV